MRIEGIYIKHLIDKFLIVITAYLKFTFFKYPIILIVRESWLILVLPFIIR